MLHIGNTDGCLWELQQCMDNQLGKTIFIVSTEEGYDIMYYRISSINLTNMYISPNCHKTVL